ncbi:MAG: IS21 family transposase [Gemmatimonadota bacterium]
MISAQLAAEIRRLSEIEGWPIETIARHLGVHHSAVRRVLAQDGLSAVSKLRRVSMLDPFVPFIVETFERYPQLPASVLYEMVQRRGYPGGEDHFRHRIADLGLRPRKAPEAFFVLRTLPGEQAQVDWAHFGTRKVDGGERRLYAFVLVLSYSRSIFLRFFYDLRLGSFLAGHVAAFAFFGGVAKSLLYDNLRSAVLERRGSAIRLNPRLLELADHYGFDPRPVAPRRGNEKGRVERAIRYVRSSFFPLRRHWDIERLNEDALVWCRDRAARRKWPQDRRRTVEQAFLEERSSLLSLTGEPFACYEWIERRAQRVPYVSFDSNRYSIPHNRVARSLLLGVDPERVRIFDREELIAEHDRCWDKGQVIEIPEHLEALERDKRQAQRQRGQDRLLRAVPRAEELLRSLAKRQRHLSSAVRRLLELLAEVGVKELDEAIAEVLDRGTHHPEAVRLVLDRRRHERGQKPALPVKLPADPRVRDLHVTPHPLADYDPDTHDKEES